MRSRAVIDTNVLIYATFVDCEHHDEAYSILQRHGVVISYVVLYECLWALAKLTGEVEVVKTKLDELSDSSLVHEDLSIVHRGISMLRGNGAVDEELRKRRIQEALAMLKGTGSVERGFAERAVKESRDSR